MPAKGQAALFVDQRADVQAFARHQAVCPHQHVVARDLCPDTVASDGREVSGVVPGNALGLCRPQDGLGDGMFRPRLYGRDQSQHFGPVKTFR